MGYFGDGRRIYADLFVLAVAVSASSDCPVDRLHTALRSIRMWQYGP
jgi:hypothetical protein